MRRIVVGLVVAAALLLPACSDQPTEIRPPDNPEPSSVTAPVAGCPTTPTAASLLTLVNELIPRSPLRTSVILLIGGLPPRIQDRINIAVRRLIFPIQDVILRAFYAGRLTGGKSDATFDKVLNFIRALYCYVGLTPPLPSNTTAGEDVAVGVFFPTTPTTTLVVPSEHAAVTIPRGAAPAGGVTVVIRILPDNPGPLLTSLDQYPLFYEFSGITATGPVTFTTVVTAGICLRDNIDVPDGNLRLAHNTGTAFGQVEVLSRPASVFGLDCENLGGTEAFGSSTHGGWGSVARVLSPLAEALLPEPAHAASIALLTAGVGGTTRKFSPFGVVDILSNPGSLLRDGPAESNVEAGSTVTRTVRVTSANQTPIANVPVTFSTEDGTIGTPQPVLTNADGEASASWTVPEGSGIYTLNVEAPTLDNSPAGLAPPGGNVTYLPDVAFNPASLTFTGTVASPLTLTQVSGDGQTGFTNQILTDPLVVRVTRDGEPQLDIPVSFLVTAGGGTVPATATTDSDGRAEAIWTLGGTAGANNQTVTASLTGGTPVTFTASATESPLARIVLQWGESPADLDAHLTGPQPPEGRFHVYYASRGTLLESPFANLDRDDTNSFGPEIIMIGQQFTGEYRFSVHDFSNLAASEAEPSAALSQSGAKVTVYLASGSPQTFNVPPDAPGTLWTVFTLSENAITAVNTMSYTSNSGDIGAFSVLARSIRAVQPDAAIIGEAAQGHSK